MNEKRGKVSILALVVVVSMKMRYVSAQKECIEDQRWNLLKLKDSLQYNSQHSTKLTTWNLTTDCCNWPGVSCGQAGDVAALDLSNESIFDGLDDSTSLVALTSLRSLNLSYNPFVTQRIPSSVYELTPLTYLNLASTNLSGPINESLSKLRFLEELHLEYNAFMSPVPLFFANFTRIKVMNLRYSFFVGEFPESIFHLPSLEVITVGGNNELSGWLPEFHPNSSIKQLVVRDTRFGGIVPKSIGNLNLINLKLDGCNFSGEIPLSLFNMTGLIVLQLDNNKFKGVIELEWVRNLPSLMTLTLSDNFLAVKANRFPLDQLQFLELNGCNMTEFPVFTNQSNLHTLFLADNRLQGSIPFLPSSLMLVELSGNSISSWGDSMGRLTSLFMLILGINRLQGEIPSSICNNTQLESLSLQRNELHGPIPECLFRNLPNLNFFDVSMNNLNGSIPDAFQEGCMMQQFSAPYNLLGGPFPKSIANCKGITLVSLSSNEMSGTFPCELTHFSELASLSLDDNFFHGDINCVGDWPKLQVMMLSFNNFTGFSAFHNSTSMVRLKSLFYLSLAKNRFMGGIPSAFCNVTSMQILDLASSHLSGGIPECVFSSLTSLIVLDLGSNLIDGSIPDSFPPQCTLKSLPISTNKFEGSIPKSLQNCADFEFLDMSYNNMNGSFPCQLKSLPKLRALILRDNFFQGGVDCIGSDDGDWRSLRIIDISRNQFSGVLPRNSFVSCAALMTDFNQNYSEIRYGSLFNTTFTTEAGQTGTNVTTPLSYQLFFLNGITASWKGSQASLLETVGLFSTIDFSQNQFHGPIPESIGLLSTVQSINVSRNSFSGAIPASIGNLTKLESLDLSNNQLSGSLPPELAKLLFLQSFDVSMNRLSGRIPTGTQLQSFPASSYRGNEGLYGPPLPDICTNESCNNAQALSTNGQDSEERLRWILESAALGFIFGLGILLGSLVFLKRCSLVEFIVSKLVQK